MFAGLGNRKRTADERDFSMVGEAGSEISAAIGVGYLAIAAQVDAAQDDAPPVFVDEPSSFDVQPWQIHGARLTQCLFARQAASAYGGELARERDNCGPVRRRFAGRAEIRRHYYQRVARRAGRRAAAGDPDAVPGTGRRDA